MAHSNNKNDDPLRQPTYSYHLPAASKKPSIRGSGQTVARRSIDPPTSMKSNISQLPSVPSPPPASIVTGLPSTRPQTFPRVPTQYYPLGNSQRTIIEGMISNTQFQREREGLAQPSYLIRDTTAVNKTATLAPPPSRAPAHVPSIFVTPADTHMATMQTRLDTLSPQALHQQDIWARGQLLRSGVCPQGFVWDKADDFGGGYLCQGKKHFVSNQLLADGQGGVFLWAGWPEPEEIYGPYYRDMRNEELMVYGGVEPRDRYAPENFRVARIQAVEKDVVGTAEQLSQMTIGGRPGLSRTESRKQRAW